MSKHIAYKALIVDMSEVDYKKHHDGNPEVGFYKFYWQLLYHKFNYYITGSSDALLIHLDHKESSYSLSQLKLFLNQKYFRHRKLVNPVRNVEAIDSKESVIVQLVDIFTGAIGFHSNEYDLVAGASESRIAIAKKVCEFACVSRLCNETRWKQSHFEIWPMKFRQ